MNNSVSEGKKPLYFGNAPEKKYLIVPSFDTIAYDKKDYAKSSYEIEKFVNTNAVLNRLSYIFNDLVMFMARNGIAFDQISLSTITGIVCSESYYNDLKNMLSDSYSESQIKDLLSKMSSETYSDVVPVSFKVDLDLTGKNDTGIDLNLVSNDVKKKLSEYEVNGLVHFDEFLVGLRELGLNVNSVDGELISYNDYLNMIKENDAYGTWFSVETYYHNRKAQNDGIKL